MQDDLTTETDFQEQTLKEGYYNTKQCLSLLNLTIKLWNAVREEENLLEQRIQLKKGSSLTDFYPMDIIDKLVLKQKQLLEDIRNNYYTYSQVRELLERTEQRLTKEEKKLKSAPAPSLIRGFLDKRDKFWLYSKETINDYLEKQKLKELRNVSLENEYDTFLYQLDVEGIKFQEHLKDTELLWTTFVRSKLLISNQSEVTAFKRRKQFVRCTEFLLGLPSEIFTLTAKEINLSILSPKVLRSYREILYLFLREVEASFKDAKKRTFNIQQLKNPFNEKKERKSKEIYDFEDYSNLFEYVNNTNLHKDLALRDVQNYLSDKEYAYKRYDSAWLYLLVHLNNPWRHSDITDSFPRLELRELGIEDLSWFEKNTINQEISKKIINQIKRKALVHNKTGSKRLFFCSEELAVSFATASVICELRTQKDNPLSHTIVDFMNKHHKFNETIEAHFFELMKPPISFKSRKMNRTIISYMYSIISQNKISNELEVAKYFRGHKDFETTNIYIDIPQSQIDFLTSQLFDRGHFGYIPKIFTQLLYGEQESEVDMTESVVALQQRFGSIQKVEATAGFLNEIYSERKTVEEIIRGMSRTELQSRFQQLNTYQLPSKESEFQCLVSKTGCAYPNRECISCPLSIPNFYALSSISDRFIQKILYLMTEFEKLEHKAEQTKFANLFHLDMMLLKEAIEKFGKDEVFSFMDITSEQMNLLLRQLPSLSPHITIRDKGE